MADKYDDMIDAVAGGRDKYDDLIDSAMKDAPNDPPTNTGLWNAANTKDLSGASLLDPLAGMARVGQFANRGNQQLASGIAEGAGRLGAAMDRNGIPGGTAMTVNGIAAGGALGTASEFLLPQNRLGAAGLLLGPAMKAYQALRGPAVAGAKPGIMAQIGQARTKVPAGDIQQAINDPSVFKAPSVEDANKAYGVAAGPLQSAARSLGARLNKTVLGEADYTEAINQAGRVLNGTELDAAGKAVQMDGQTAMEGVQSVNRFLKNKAMTSKLDKPQLSSLYELKSGLMDWMEQNGNPGMRAAALDLRKAHVAENLSNILPQNKFGGNDAMRTMFSGGQLAGAAGLALAGHPVAAVPIAAEAITASPAVLGGAIRNYHSLSSPEVMNGVGQALNAAQNAPPIYRVQSALSDAYMRQQPAR